MNNISTYSYPSSLDSHRHNRNRRFCGMWSMQGSEQLQERPTWRYSRLGCKRWNCSKCGPRKANRVRRAIIQQATEKGLCRLLTLTLNPTACSPAESIGYLRECWNKFRTSLKRKFSSSISFIAVTELQKSGYAHLHVLVDRYIEQSWISIAWQAVGGGLIIDIRYVDIHRVGPYLSKYLTKQIFLSHFTGRQRRYTTSRNIRLFSKTTKNWRCIRAPLQFLRTQIIGKIGAESYDSDGQLEFFDVSEAIPFAPELLTIFSEKTRRKE